MGTSVSHNKAVSNEVKEGDLCVSNIECTVTVCESMFLSQICIFAHVCSVIRVTEAWACEPNGKQLVMSSKILDALREHRKKEKTQNNTKTSVDRK